jgi:aminoglycoside phosphotransferase (APT) family kinase protein
MADVGMLMAYWPDRDQAEVALGQPANLAPGFPTREQLAARYAERSGRDLSQLDFFVALGYWKLAIILEGVYARYAAGQYGKVDPGIEEFARIVERLAAAAEAAERQGD